METVLPRMRNQIIVGIYKLRITCILLWNTKANPEVTRESLSGSFSFAAVLEVGVNTKVFKCANRIRNSRNHCYVFVLESSHKIMCVLKMRQIGLNWANRSNVFHNICEK